MIIRFKEVCGINLLHACMSDILLIIMAVEMGVQSAEHLLIAEMFGCHLGQLKLCGSEGTSGSPHGTFVINHQNQQINRRKLWVGGESRKFSGRGQGPDPGLHGDKGSVSIPSPPSSTPQRSQNHGEDALGGANILYNSRHVCTMLAVGLPCAPMCVPVWAFFSVVLTLHMGT